MQEVDRTMLSPRQVFHQTHDEAVLAVRIDNDRGDLALAKSLKGFKLALPGNEIIARTFWRYAPCYRNRPLEADTKPTDLINQ